MLKQILLGLILSIILILLLGAFFFHFSDRHALKIVESQSRSVSLEDGIYKGTYYTVTSIPAAKVQFSVKDDRLINFWVIHVLHIPGYEVKGEIQKSIGNEGIDFDAVTGATISSRFVQAAIVNAIKAKK